MRQGEYDGRRADEGGVEQPELAAFGATVAAEDSRRLGHDTRATWRAVAEAWRKAGQPYQEAYARLREAAAAVKAGRREQAMRALAACQDVARELRAVPLLTQAENLARRARLDPRAAKPVRSAEPGARFDLTDREMEILGRLVNGDSNRQIARALFISERTVAVHVSRILGKLGVRNRTEAATVGARLGLLARSRPRCVAVAARPSLSVAPHLAGRWYSTAPPCPLPSSSRALSPRPRTRAQSRASCPTTDLVARPRADDLTGQPVSDGRSHPWTLACTGSAR